MALVALNNRLTDKNTTHSYLPLYETLLAPIRYGARNVLEVGVNTGGSIKLWYDYFPNATIYGYDISERGLMYRDMKNVPRIVLNLNENAYTSECTKKLEFKFDFLLDDGPHTLESQEAFVELYSPLLSDNGILIIEDVQDIAWLAKLRDKTPEHLLPYVRAWDLRANKGRYDDIVFAIDCVSR